MIIILVYILAACAGILVFLQWPEWQLLQRLLAADVAATLVVWMAGVVFRNSSIYDPYWSVAPLVILPLMAAYLNVWSVGTWLVLALVFLWGVRLTANWASTWRCLAVQDWRYDHFKQNKRWWPLINLFGINLFPTVIVFLVLVPAIWFMENFSGFNAGIILGAAICAGAVLLQAAADAQMHQFRQQGNRTGQVNRIGLWKYIRHPNYLGEILMWSGVFLMLFFTRSDLWPAALGALANTLMFIFISVPLMEKRQLKSKPSYADYIAVTGMLLPRPNLLLRSGRRTD